jgi:hypothetical protein
MSRRDATVVVHTTCPALSARGKWLEMVDGVERSRLVDVLVADRSSDERYRQGGQNANERETEH